MRINLETDTIRLNIEIGRDKSNPSLQIYIETDTDRLNIESDCNQFLQDGDGLQSVFTTLQLQRLL